MRFFRKIVGERIYLSPLDVSDAELHVRWAEWMNEKTVAATYGGFDNLVTVPSAKKTLEELQGYRFGVVLTDGDLLIGHVSLHNVDQLHRHAFLGIVIGEAEYRNKGYGTEAVRLAVEYGFRTLNLHNIMLSINPNNHPAVACYKKVGFKEAGLRREWVYENGKYTDVIYMDMLESEFGVL